LPNKQKVDESNATNYTPQVYRIYTDFGVYFTLGRTMSTTTFCGVNLTWSDFYWSGSPDVLGATELLVATEDEQEIPPSPLQEAAWYDFLQSNSEIHRRVLDAVFRYYNEMRPRYEAMGIKWVEKMPKILSPDFLENMIQLQSIALSWPYSGDDVQIGLTYSCEWEVEHGLGVVLVNREVRTVGGADCAIV
jgi:hypothetical protein